MASQKPVGQSTGPTFVQSTEPAANERFVGASWVDTLTVPYLLKTWDGSTWVVQDYLSIEGVIGIAGYIAGGYGPLTTISRLSFTSDVTSVLVSSLPQSRGSGCGVNSFTGGYACGGGSPLLTVVDKLLFSSEAVSTISSGLITAKYKCGGSNSDSNGYVIGGYDGAVYVTSVDRISFSNESLSSITSASSPAVYCSACESLDAGYYTTKPAPSVYTTVLEKLIFSSESVSSLSSGLSVNKALCAAVSNNAKAYFAGGATSDSVYSPVSNIDRMIFSNESTINLASTLSVARYPNGVNSSVSGYAVSGSGSSTVIDKIAFSDDVSSVLASGLSVAAQQAASFENLN